jgi:hypothetical protein
MGYSVPSITTSGATFAQLQAGGLSSVLELLITANGTATVAPTVAPTLAGSGSGGTLPAATYYVVNTETNESGETTIGPVSAGQVITLGLNLVITYSTLKTGNTARNAYVGLAAIGPFTLAADGVTASTTTISAPLPTSSYAVHPPTINSTGFEYTDSNGNVVNAVPSNIRSFKNGNFPTTYKNAAQLLDFWLRGDPLSETGIMAKWRHFATAVAVLNQACTDIGTLVDANAGTIRPTSTGIGGSTPQRSWP